MTDRTQWRPASQDPTLRAREIHLWRVALDQSTDLVETLRAVLTPSELLRAERLRSPLHGRRFIVGRASLRLILAGYTGEDATDILFEHNAHGKPYLSDTEGHAPNRPIRFNLTHSDSLAVVAITSDVEVGIDIERLREMPSADRLVERFFAVGEQRAYDQVPVSERQMAFFQPWTRKEAYIKALGQGLAIPLGNFEVSLEQMEKPAILRKENQPPSAAPDWWIQPFDPGTDFVGAVSADSPNCVLRYWQWLPGQ